MNRLLYFDCPSGISGDMTVAALLDIGLDHDEFKRQLALLELPGYEIEIGRRDNGGIEGCDFTVVLTGKEHAHRNLTDIEQIVRSSSLQESIQQLSMSIFHHLAEAEAAVHGVPVEEIHFHEVGAIDSIVDIVAAAICIEMLEIDDIQASPIPFGTGYVKCAHGLLPVPVPATVEILKGVPVYQTDIKGELVTPTGAAIVRTLAGHFGNLPAMEISATGYGAGKKQFDRPNLLRVFLGNAASTNDSDEEDLVVLETNIDDMSPEVYSYLLPILLERGALDTFVTQVIMKKGRPGILLSVLCRSEHQTMMEKIIFRETTTLGIRKQLVRRRCLPRQIITIDSHFGKIRLKQYTRTGGFSASSPNTRSA